MWQTSLLFESVAAHAVLSLFLNGMVSLSQAVAASMRQSMMPFYICHCVKLCDMLKGHLKVIPFALLLITSALLFNSIWRDQIAEFLKPKSGTSQAKVWSLTSQIAEPHKSKCRTSQAKLATSELWTVSTDT